MAEEELNQIRPDLDGNAIMEILNIPASPIIGRAYKYLLELRMDEGPLGPERAQAALMAWWSENQPKS